MNILNTPERSVISFHNKSMINLIIVTNRSVYAIVSEVGFVGIHRSSVKMVLILLTLVIRSLNLSLMR